MVCSGMVSPGDERRQPRMPESEASHDRSVACLNETSRVDQYTGNHDEAFMRRALALARHAAAHGEVPVGALLVIAGKIAGEGWNQSILKHDPSAHAEIQALRAAGERLANYRFPGSTLYVTLEPCPMCVGAILHARVTQIVFAAADTKTGALGGAFDLQAAQRHNHRCRVTGGVLSEPAGELLRRFFQARRRTAT